MLAGSRSIATIRARQLSRFRLNLAKPPTPPPPAASQLDAYALADRGNEARIGYTRVHRHLTIDPDGVLGKNGDQKLEFLAANRSPERAVTLGGDFTNIGSAASDRNTTDNDFHYSDNLTKLVGHALKMGFNFLRYQMNNYYAGNNGLLGVFTYDEPTAEMASRIFCWISCTPRRGSQTGCGDIANGGMASPSRTISRSGAT